MRRFNPPISLPFNVQHWEGEDKLINAILLLKKEAMTDEQIMAALPGLTLSHLNSLLDKYNAQRFIKESP